MDQQVLKEERSSCTHVGQRGQPRSVRCRPEQLLQEGEVEIRNAPTQGNGDLHAGGFAGQAAEGPAPAQGHFPGAPGAATNGAVLGKGKAAG